MEVGKSRVSQIHTLAAKHLRTVMWETTLTIGEAQMLACEITYAAS